MFFHQVLQCHEVTPYRKNLEFVAKAGFSWPSTILGSFASLTSNFSEVVKTEIYLAIMYCMAQIIMATFRFQLSGPSRNPKKNIHFIRGGSHIIQYEPRFLQTQCIQCEILHRNLYAKMAQRPRKRHEVGKTYIYCAFMKRIKTRRNLKAYRTKTRGFTMPISSDGHWSIPQCAFVRWFQRRDA